MTLDEELLRNQTDGLLERIREGWRVVQLPRAPLHIPGCDDVANRFVWYRVDRPLETGGYEVHGYLHYTEAVL